MKRINFQLIIVVFTVSLLAMSCRKNQDKNDATEIAQQSSLAQKNMNDAGVMSAEAIAGAYTTFAATCATITYDTTGTAKTITIDYGTTDCVCADGKRRRGKLLVTTNGVFNGLGVANNIVTSTDGYYVNDNLIDGVRTMTKLNATDSKIVSTATVTLPDDRGVFSWNGDFTRRFLSGDNTPYANDDEYEVTGSGGGINTKEVEYTLTVTDPLLIQTGCRWIKGGILTISADNMKDDATLEYGDGSCDNVATLKYKNKEEKITL